MAESATLSVLVLSACGAMSATALAQSGHSQSGHSQSGNAQTGGALSPPGEAPSLPTPLATSVRASGGTWATVAMGDLSQPLNTFWQLLFRPDGSASWSDQVEATAVATNGGIVLAGGGGPLIVGVRPSNDLTFSPLIRTANAGRSWSNGLLTEGLAARPQALAGGPSGGALALVNERGGPQVVRDAGSLSSWQPLTTAHGLATGSYGRACDPDAITAVGYLGGAAVVGTACRRPGQAGIFVQSGKSWRAVGTDALSSGSPGSGRPGSGPPATGPPATEPPASGPPASGLSTEERAEVLGLIPAGSGLVALIGLSTAGGKGTTAGVTNQTSLVASWTGTSGTWSPSPPFRLGRGSRLVSFGGEPEGGVFALVAHPDGQMSLAEAAKPGSGWQTIPAPPGATATVAFLPGGTVDALAVKRDILTVWALTPGATTWVKAQVLDVPVQFGSSS
jgi:hypothetical protein